MFFSTFVSLELKFKPNKNIMAQQEEINLRKILPVGIIILAVICKSPMAISSIGLFPVTHSIEKHRDTNNISSRVDA